MSICYLCKKNYKKSYLKKHIDVVHNKNKPHKCTNCEFKCSSKHNLRKHTCNIRCVDGVIINEKSIQKRLQTELNGRSKRCDAGVVDILTEDYVIEIKLWARYRQGIGQILDYGICYPDKKKRLHLFGVKPNATKIAHIGALCKSVNVELMYE